MLGYLISGIFFYNSVCNPLVMLDYVIVKSTATVAKKHGNQDYNNERFAEDSCVSSTRRYRSSRGFYEEWWQFHETSFHRSSSDNHTAPGVNLEIHDLD